jgi:hypothetical protein
MCGDEMRVMNTRDSSWGQGVGWAWGAGVVCSDVDTR